MSISICMFIDLLAQDLSPRPRCVCQSLEHLLGVLPADAGVGDRDAVFETRFTLRGDFLVSYIKWAL